MTAARPRAWPWVVRGLTLAFFTLLIWLLIERARGLDWAQVGAALRGYDATLLLLAAALAAASHGLYSCFDLFGRHYTGHRLATARVMCTAFVSYAFNLNLGALIGGVGFRYRLYSRYGLPAGQITRVLGLSMVTNWLGYLLLAGLLFAAGGVALPEHFRLGAAALRAVGAALLLVLLAYFWFCAFSRRREWRLRELRVQLPSLRVAALQLALSVTNWLLIAAVLYVLLDAAVPFALLLGVLLIAAIAGVITHVPAGLGVIEAVFLALLGERLAQADLLAALLAYRAIYYLAPLALATLAYLRLEARARAPRTAAA